ncbi:MAG: peptidoglycan editing factor PgeF, partial [Undibacterium sp.]|nr:peptidoglycan editing factor PgeF [Undibacterium sp.]
GDDMEHVTANRAMLNALLPAPVTFLTQMHGNMAVDMAQVQGETRADAAWTSRSKTVCAVLTADCLPILLSDSVGCHVAAIHAGWRGLAGGVVQATVRQLREQGAQNLSAWLGPAISAHAFEVGADVLAAFSKQVKNAELHFQPIATPNKYVADIYGLARAILLDLGVTHVYGGEYCTVIDRDLFYSYRRDHVTGRMASLIWMD